MSGALHDVEAPNAHKRLHPVELLPYSLGDAPQALDRLKEGHVTGIGAAGRNDLQECVVGQRGQRQLGGSRLPCA